MVKVSHVQSIMEQLQWLIKNQNYLKESKPPIAGDPIITASVTIIPKAIPTIMKRLFIQKLFIS